MRFRSIRDSLKLVYLFLCLSVISIPVLATFTLLNQIGGSLSNFVPTYSGVYNDAMLYWRQIYTFSQVGFNGGYYTTRELPARAAFSHYYVYGPIFPAFYGGIGHFFGWYNASAVFINLLLVTAALAVFIVAVRPDKKQLVALGVLLVTFWPLLLYLPSNMQESFQDGLAILLAAVFFRLLTARSQASVRLKIGIFCLIAFAALARVTWALLFLPYFWVVGGDEPLYRRWIKAGVSMGAFFGVFLYWSSPYPGNFISQFTTALASNPGQAARLFADHIQLNLGSLLTSGRLHVFQRLQIVLLALVSATGSISLNWIRKFTAALLPERTEQVFHWTNLGLIFLLNLLLYDMFAWRDYRAMATHLLLSALLLLAFRRFWLVALIVVVNVLNFTLFIRAYQVSWSPEFSYDQGKIAEFQGQTSPYIEYDASAANAWCNTVLLERRYDAGFAVLPEVMSFPAGIGVSSFIDDLATTALPPKSKYLLISQDTYNHFARQLHVEPLVNTAVGNLYLNLDANCPPQPG